MQNPEKWDPLAYELSCFEIETLGFQNWAQDWQYEFEFWSTEIRIWFLSFEEYFAYDVWAMLYSTADSISKRDEFW